MELSVIWVNNRFYILTKKKIWQSKKIVIVTFMLKALAGHQKPTLCDGNTRTSISLTYKWTWFLLPVRSKNYFIQNGNKEQNVILTLNLHSSFHGIENSWETVGIRWRLQYMLCRLWLNGSERVIFSQYRKQETERDGESILFILISLNLYKQRN